MADHIFMTEVVQPALIKDGGLFLACENAGDVSVTCGSGLGLYYRDTRYLSRYELRLGGQPALALMSSAARGDQAVQDLTNPLINGLDGKPLDIQSFGVRLERTIDGSALTLTDRLIFRNYTLEPIAFEASILLDALFEDIFELRGAPAGKRGPTRKVTSIDGGLAFRYRGADDVSRSLEIRFSRAPTISHRRGARVATFDIRLESQATETIAVTFVVSDSGAAAHVARPVSNFYTDTVIRSDNPQLDRLLQRSFRDLTMLRTDLEASFIAGGMPWFVAPFGRDSILAAIHTLPFDPRPAEGVARLFTLYQGRVDAPETHEQPGKIPHEFRFGAMARLKEVPHRPSYLSIDATPLFLILIGEHVRWTGDAALFGELEAAIDAALKWIDRQVAEDRRGYLSYRGDTLDGPINQGWKDSTTGVPRKNGTPPATPIALCEVQGYVYLAWVLMADAYRLAGDAGRAATLEIAAGELRDRFNRDFWMEDEGCFALALEKGGRQVTSVASNTGQVLWTGIAESGKAARIVSRLMEPDMDCGWGVRTLSDREASYNPLNYHLGSVWPFDNALIVAGMRRYGFDADALKLFNATIDASGYFALGRLPEFYVGFQREADLFPARCPFAEPMQAWSASAAPYMLATLLGLEPGEGKPRFKDPILPAHTSRIEFALWVSSRRFQCCLVKQESAELHVDVVAMS
jgi:glycogen debranching enzyme